MPRRNIRISLVVPVRDEELSLPSLIRSICAQTRPPEEIILVDGGSTDRSAAIARQMASTNARFRLLDAGVATPGRGRNVGIATASCDWIALTDAGIRLEPEWLERLAAVAERDPSVDVVYGNFEPLAASLFERCAALSYPPAKTERPGGRMRGPSVASCLLRRAVWEAVEGFPDLRAAEDLIFLERIHARGFKIGWAPSATVWWQLQPTLARTFRKFVLYSRHNAHAGRQRDWHYGVARKYVLALPFVGLCLLGHPFWLGVPVVGAMARVATSIRERREDRSLIPLLNPAQFLLVGAILLTIDLATFVGWAQALKQRLANAGLVSPAAPSEVQR